MLKKTTIVCVIDLSSASRQSLPLASKLAREKGAKLVIVHLVPNSNWSIYSILTSDPGQELAEAVKRAEPFVRDIMSSAPDVDWELRVEPVNTAATIEAVAEEVGAELLLSARRRGKLEVLKSVQPIEPVINGLTAAHPSLPLTPKPIIVTARQAAPSAI